MALFNYMAIRVQKQEILQAFRPVLLDTHLSLCNITQGLDEGFDRSQGIKRRSFTGSGGVF